VNFPFETCKTRDVTRTFKRKNAPKFIIGAFANFSRLFFISFAIPPQLAFTCLATITIKLLVQFGNGYTEKNSPKERFF
jgi:hypothetical protein